MGPLMWVVMVEGCGGKYQVQCVDLLSELTLKKTVTKKRIKSSARLSYCTIWGSGQICLE